MKNEGAFLLREMRVILSKLELYEGQTKYVQKIEERKKVRILLV